jgi:hypothetical protein
MAIVTWVKCQANNWCPFETVTLDSISKTIGVYVIWHEGNPSRVVRVGQGDIAECPSGRNASLSNRLREGT